MDFLYWVKSELSLKKIRAIWSIFWSKSSREFQCDIHVSSFERGFL